MIILAEELNHDQSSLFTARCGERMMAPRERRKGTEKWVKAEENKEHGVEGRCAED